MPIMSWSDSSWETEPEDRWYGSDLKSQNESSSTPIAYDGGSSIFRHPKPRSTSVKFGFVHLPCRREYVQRIYAKNRDFRRSVEPGQAEFENLTGRDVESTSNGNHAGPILAGPQISANDVIRPLGSLIVPIPKNVEMRATDGTPP